MAGDDAKFVIVLLLSVVASLVLRACPTGARADASALLGAALIVFACGWSNALHPLSAVVISAVCAKVIPSRHRPWVCFASAFGHLALLRMLPTPPGGPTNAALLVLVLRLAAADGAVAAGVDGNRGAREIIRYTLCYHGLFTAPYLPYAEWAATMRAPRPLPSARVLGQTLLQAVGAICVWRGVGSFLPYSVVWTTPSGAVPFHTRLSYFYLSSFQFRWRFYACWLTMQLGGELLGHARPSNADLVATELCTSPSQYIGGWNTSVQSWLKANVYRGLLPDGTPRPLRQLATFAVSAFWHGVRPGYYLFFLGLFAMVCVEQLVRAAYGACGGGLGHGRSGGGGCTAQALGATLVALACHLWTMLCFGFFGGAFNLLVWSDVLALWKALHFYGIWLTALPAVLGMLVLGRQRLLRAAQKSSTSSSAVKARSAQPPRPPRPPSELHEWRAPARPGGRAPARTPTGHWHDE